MSALKIYLDTNIFIYFVEFDNELHRAAKTRIADFEKRDAEIVISRLTFLECIYGPSRAGSTALVEMYRAMLTDNPGIRLVEMTCDILESAALNGGKLGLKLQGAIHYFTALYSGCNLIVTNDRRFKSTPSVAVEYLAARH